MIEKLSFSFITYSARGTPLTDRNREGFRRPEVLERLASLKKALMIAAALLDLLPKDSGHDRWMLAFVDLALMGSGRHRSGSIGSCRCGPD